VTSKIYFYKTSSGKEIIIDEINKLDSQSIIKTRNAIRLFEQYGLNLINAKWVKKINKNPSVFELRVTGNKQIRILFSEISPNEFLFTNIFVKKSQKTPMKEIETAIKRLNEFI